MLKAADAIARLSVICGDLLYACARLDGMADERLAVRPDGTRYTMSISDHGLERTFDPLAVRIGNDQRRQKLDRGNIVTRNLAQNLMLREERNCDELAEQAFVHR